MANKHMKISASLIAGGMQITATTRHCLTPIRVAVIKKQNRTKGQKCQTSAEDLEPSCVAGGNGERRSCRGKQSGGPRKAKHRLAV